MTESRRANARDGDASGNSAAPADSICPNCEKRFACGAKSGAARCWCFDLPPVPPSNAFSNCLCPACLAAYAATQPPG